MGTRRKSRELAMQMLFQGDLGKQKPEEVERLFWASRDDVDDETPMTFTVLPRSARMRWTS
jgi:N utilization substance protein B